MLSILNIISSTHNCCEDSVFVNEQPNGNITGGVFDGCSTGIKSHWASQTFAYLFSQHVSAPFDPAIITVWKDLRMIKEILQLNSDYFLCTCMLFYYEKFSKRLYLRAFGDGLFWINDLEYEIEQNNQPDYMGYYLEDYRNFEKFMQKYPVKTFNNVDSFRICSDGIKHIERSQFVPPTDYIPEILLHKPPISPNYLQRMWNILKREHYTLSDDLSIISYANDTV